MKNCHKCGSNIPFKIRIDGKEHNLQRRKYCLKCSPFGLHNTARLHTSRLLNENRVECKQKNCKLCGKSMYQVKGAKCWSCASKKSRECHAQALFELMGARCWICGYNKCRGAMDYHHVDPSKKLFQLNMREMQYAWNRILEEARKCVLLCSRCHREYHCGLIGDNLIAEIYENTWHKIGPLAQR